MKLPTEFLLETRLGALRVGFWTGTRPLLGRSCGPLRRLLGALGRLLASLGRFLGASWAIIGRSWPFLGWFGPLLGCILTPRASPGLDFKGFGDVPGLVLEGFKGML